MKSDDSAASRLAALRQHPEVAKAWRELREFMVCGERCREAGGPCPECDAALAALLSAVAAAATAQTGLTEDEAKAVDELRQGGGTYYVTQERAFAPGIAKPFPAVIAVPKDANARLVKRVWPVRALAGGAPPATQTTDTTEE